MIAHAAITPLRKPRTIALTGATGYVGGRLAPELLVRGYRLRCLVRHAPKLAARQWASDPNVHIVECDLQNETELETQLKGCDAAYYLVHSMLSAGRAYAEHDQQLAQVFSRAAQRAGVQRIIYLGGLGDDQTSLSKHLASRREVEAALQSSGIAVTVLRAAMIIGSGSASFEILRYLVERLPIMITPRWVRTECQPISIRNVIGYLADALDNEQTAERTIDIGGPEVVTYHQLMRMMARALGLRQRIVIPVPVLTPRLSALWIHLVTPLSSHIARPLAEGLRNRVVCRDDQAQQLLPQKLLTPRQAIEAAVIRVRGNEVKTAWSDAGPMPGDPDWAGGTSFIDERSVQIAANRTSVFTAVCRVGGGHGYYAADWLWRARGALDRLVGGPGLRRGRRDASALRYGDALDFWRITRIERDRILELRAEMKLPGIATLSFELHESSANQTRLVQTARFRPRGLGGLLYWYAVLPLHAIVFRGLLNGISRHAIEIHGRKNSLVSAECNSPQHTDGSPERPTQASR